MSRSHNDHAHAVEGPSACLALPTLPPLTQECGRRKDGLTIGAEHFVDLAAGLFSRARADELIESLEHAQQLQLLAEGTRGDHELACRATDANGNVQPLEAVWNYQGLGNNAVQRIAIRVR